MHIPLLANSGVFSLEGIRQRNKRKIKKEEKRLPFILKIDGSNCWLNSVLLLGNNRRFSRVCGEISTDSCESAVQK